MGNVAVRDDDSTVRRELFSEAKVQASSTHVCNAAACLLNQEHT
jgi:hypothetical protein